MRMNVQVKLNLFRCIFTYEYDVRISYLVVVFLQGRENKKEGCVIT